MEGIKQRNDGILKNTLFLIKESFLFDKRIIVFITITIFTGIILPLMGIYLPKIAVDLIVSKADVMQIVKVLGSVVAAMLFLQGVHGYLTSRSYFHQAEFRNTYFVQNIFLVSIKCRYSYAESGEFAKIYRRAVNSVRSGDESGTTVFFNTIPQLIVETCCFFLYSKVLSNLNIFVVVFLVASSLVIYFFRHRENVCYERTKDDYAKSEKKLFYTIAECGNDYPGKDIRIYNMKQWFIKMILRFQGEERDIIMLRRKKKYETHLVSCALNFARDAFAYVYLIIQTVNGNIGMGDFLLYFGAITGFSVWITDMVEQMSQIKEANIKVNDLRTFLDIPGEDMEEAECEMPDISEGVSIEFDNISFAYPGSNKNIISNMSFCIEKGEHVALVGLNGAGKTTLLKLMVGMYEPVSGVIRINGTDITKIRKKDIYELYSAVFQDRMILPAMIDENIALKPKYDIDKNRIEEVLRLSGLYEYLEENNISVDRYMTRQLTEDGIFLSGGQEQKFLLARALYKDAPVLLLDEPTASLDPISEQEVYVKYEELCKNKTALFISHRLASTQFSDRILFLQEGHIIEQGSHEELLKAGGEYKKLYEMQSYYYNLKDDMSMLGEEEYSYEC